MEKGDVTILWGNGEKVKELEPPGDKSAEGT